MEAGNRINRRHVPTDIFNSPHVTKKTIAQILHGYNNMWFIRLSALLVSSEIIAARKQEDSSNVKYMLICSDRTIEDRKMSQEPVASLKQKMKEEPNKRFFIDRSGKVLTVLSKLIYLNK